MNKTPEQWQKIDAQFCAKQNSVAANYYLIRDAQQDIAELVSLYKMHQETETREMLDLRAERDALKADAERYRKLRTMSWYDSPLCVVRAPKQQVKPGTDCPSYDRLDEALDSL